MNRDVELPLGMTHMRPNGQGTYLPKDLETLRKKFSTLVSEGYFELGIDYEKILDSTAFCKNNLFVFDFKIFELSLTKREYFHVS